MGFLDDTEIPIPCLECGKETAKTIAWVKRHKKFTCPGYGTVISLQTDQFRRMIAKNDRAYEEFRKKMGKGFDIKL